MINIQKLRLKYSDIKNPILLDTLIGNEIILSCINRSSIRYNIVVGDDGIRFDTKNYSYLDNITFYFYKLKLNTKSLYEVSNILSLKSDGISVKTISEPALIDDIYQIKLAVIDEYGSSISGLIFNIKMLDESYKNQVNPKWVKLPLLNENVFLMFETKEYYLSRLLVDVVMNHSMIFNEKDVEKINKMVINGFNKSLFSRLVQSLIKNSGISHEEFKKEFDDFIQNELSNEFMNSFNLLFGLL